MNTKEQYTKAWQLVRYWKVRPYDPQYRNMNEALENHLMRQGVDKKIQGYARQSLYERYYDGFMFCSSGIKDHYENILRDPTVDIKKRLQAMRLKNRIFP